MKLFSNLFRFLGFNKKEEKKPLGAEERKTATQNTGGRTNPGISYIY
jgi:hypothetical protein